MERVVAERANVVERVVAIASPLATEDHTPLPGAVRQPEELRLSREGRAGIDVVARDVVDREALAVHLREGQTDAELVGSDRTRDAAADRPRAVVPKRHGERACPGRYRRARARDVHQAAQRVAAEQRALRTADELNLIHIKELDTRRVGAQLRHAVDIGGDARIVRARADAAEARVAQFSRRPLGKEGVRRKDRGLTDDVDAGAVDGVFRHGCDADRNPLLVLRLLLRCDRDRWHAETDGWIILRRAALAGTCRLRRDQSWDERDREDAARPATCARAV